MKVVIVQTEGLLLGAGYRAPNEQSLISKRPEEAITALTLPVLATPDYSRYGSSAKRVRNSRTLGMPRRPGGEAIVRLLLCTGTISRHARVCFAPAFFSGLTAVRLPMVQSGSDLSDGWFSANRICTCGCSHYL